MDKNRQLIISIMVMSIGIFMLLGTSYALVTKSSKTDTSYGLTVGSINVNFSEENNITLNNAYPISDQDGLKNSNEFSFTVINNGDYDVNYTLKIEETSYEKIGEIIRYSYNRNNTGYNVVAGLKDSDVINQNIVLKKGASDIYKMKFWISEDTTSKYMNKAFSGKIIIEATQNDYKYATNVIETLAKKMVDNVLAVNVNGEFGNENIREYRYVSNDSINVNNYVWFNCKDGYTKGSNYCEKWRIVGSFTNYFESSDNSYSSLKLVRDELLDEKVTFKNYNNYLNDKYYDSLTINTKNMIMKSRFNVGIGLYANLFDASYESEIKETVYQNIGLINASDYAYATGVSNQGIPMNNGINNGSNWLNAKDSYLTINKVNEKNINIIAKVKDSYLVTAGRIDELYYVRPAVYLRPDVSIIDGYGTNENPYQLAIKFPVNY